MSLKPQAVNPIPEEINHVAHAAFPKGNALIRIRDHLGVNFEMKLTEFSPFFC